MAALADIAVALLLVIGAAFSLLGSLGLVRFSDVLLRLHGPTKAGTLGVGCILVASALYFSLTDPGISVHELLITLFLFLTAPVSAHLMAKCALFLAARRDQVADADHPGPDRDS
ncbi:MAG: Na+/H+ antiporter subunit G [Rhodocyclaceae bacterium]|nr:Na+/H+ antiporter subunit G [Rhodocyclaceae bacterium]